MPSTHSIVDEGRDTGSILLHNKRETTRDMSRLGRNAGGPAGKNSGPMKRTPLLFAGIIAATILVVMGLGILLTGSFYFMPAITVDPFSDRDVDGNGMLVLTGATNLGLNSYIMVNVSPGPGQVLSPGTVPATATASVMQGSGGRNSWKAAVNVSGLSPGTYMVRISSVTFNGANRTAVPGTVMVSTQFILQSRSDSGDRSGPASYLIANPVADHAPGDSIAATGITNLAPGTPVTWRLDLVQCPGDVGNDTIPAVPDGSSLRTGTTTIVTGTAGVNRWSVLLGTSGMQPGCYLLTVSGTDSSGNFPGNSTEGEIQFVLSDTAPVELPAPARFITIDSIPDQTVNSRVFITGTTSLPADEEFMVEITPLVGRGYDFVVYPDDRSQGATFAGVAGTALVVPWTGGVNLWSMDFDTYHIPPGEYEVTVRNSMVNQTTFRTEPGDVAITGTFGVREESP